MRPREVGRAGAAAVTMAAVLVAGHTGSVVEPARSAAAPPNVVVIMTDDQNATDMSVMPLTRRLIGSAGVTFRNSYVSYPLCCPSRATFLTGRYAHNHNVLAQVPPTGGYGRLNGKHTVAVWLRSLGYHTTHIGKYLNGYGAKRPHEVPPGWSEWRGSIDPTTYRYWGYRLNENGRVVTYGRQAVENPALYQTDVYAAKAERMIRRRAGNGPFFLSLAVLAPHVEAAGASDPGPRPAPRHAGRFANHRLPHPPSFNERDVSDKPRFLRGQKLSQGQIRSITRRYRNRLASLVAVDQAVARIVRALRQTGQLGKTFVFFTSDNGLFHGEYRIQTGKFFAYEPATHVPLLLRGPGIPHGAVSDELAGNIDLAPTIVALSHATPTRRMDGRSLLRFARDPGLRTRRPLLFEAYSRRDSNSNLSNPGYKAIRTRRWMYVRWVDGEKELYDMKKDRYELRSLHADHRYAGVRRELDRQLNRLVSCGGGSCRKGRPAVPAP